MEQTDYFYKLSLKKSAIKVEFEGKQQEKNNKVYKVDKLTSNSKT